MWLKFCAGVGALLLLSATTVAAELVPAAPPAYSETMTVYIDLGPFEGRENSTDDINRMHTEYNQLGWHFVELVPAHEDGDLQGFWVTYTRPKRALR